MSGGYERLSLKEDDITKMLAATTHIGSTNVDFQMEQYVYKRRADGKYCLSNHIETQFDEVLVTILRLWKMHGSLIS